MITAFHLTRKKRKPVINITSLIDVLFLLLIFFMVTSTFVKEASLKVDLPQAKGEKGVRQLKSVAVVVSLNKEITVNGSPVTIDSLQGKVKQSLQSLNDSSAVVEFIVDQGVPYGFAVQVMGELREAGVKTVMAATKDKQESPQANR